MFQENIEFEILTPCKIIIDNNIIVTWKLITFDVSLHRRRNL